MGILGVTLGLAVHFSPLDRELLLKVHRLNGLPDQLWLFLTQMGDSAIVLSLLLSVAGGSSWRRALVLKTWLLGAVASPLLKSWWDTPRPLSVLDPALLHVVGHPPAGHHAMPSGHSMAAAALAGLLIVFWARQRPVLRISIAGVAVLIALSRVAVGAHWPGDALAGLGLGALLVGMAQAWESRRPWSRVLSMPWAVRGVVVVQIVLAFVLWRQPQEGWGMGLASGVTVAFAAGSLLRLRCRTSRPDCSSAGAGDV